MMARYGGGRPGSSRRVRLEPVRRSSMDHRAVARIVLALARQMAAEADEAAQSAAVDEVVSSGAGACLRDARGTSVGRCAANEPVSASAGSGLAGRCSRQRHDGAHCSAHGASSATSHVLPDRAGTAESGEATAASSVPGGTP